MGELQIPTWGKQAGLGVPQEEFEDLPHAQSLQSLAPPTFSTLASLCLQFKNAWMWSN